MIEEIPRISSAARNLIIKDLGMLSDLPHDLANSIANHYLKLVMITFDDNKNETNLTDNENWTLKCINLIRDSIPLIRKIPFGEERDYSINSLVAIIKFHDKDFGNKTYLRIRVERIFKKAKEIPNLAEKLKIF